jgi:hypothetical protein
MELDVESDACAQVTTSSTTHRSRQCITQYAKRVCEAFPLSNCSSGRHFSAPHRFRTRGKSCKDSSGPDFGIIVSFASQPSYAASRCLNNFGRAFRRTVLSFASSLMIVTSPCDVTIPLEVPKWLNLRDLLKFANRFNLRFVRHARCCSLTAAEKPSCSPA